MAYLQLPRLYFNGFNYWTPSTYNNDDYAGYSPGVNQYDAEKAKLDWAYLRTLGVENDSEFKKWSVESTSFNQDSPKDKLPPAEWGYYGGNQCGFVTKDAPHLPDSKHFKKPEGSTVLTAYTNSDVQYINAEKDASDPWLNNQLEAQLNLGLRASAKLIDINPTTFYTSQLFGDTFTLGDDSNGFSGPFVQRLYATWQYFTRNYNLNNKQIIAGNLSVAWQTAIHKNDLIFHNQDSQLGQALQEAAHKKGMEGLMINFTSYETVYFHGPAFDGSKQFQSMERIAKLYQEYGKAYKAYMEGKTTEKPARPINPAYSRVVGWIAPWKAGDMISAANGRYLAPGMKPDKGAINNSLAVYPKEIPLDAKNPANSSLGTAVVEYESDGDIVTRISIDMGSSIPELNATSLEKADFGDIQLVLIGKDRNDLLPIANLPYDKSFYDQTSGIVDIIPHRDQKADDTLQNPSFFINQPTLGDIENHQLGITVITNTKTDKGVKSSRVLGLIEEKITAKTDQRGVYVNQPKPSWDPDAALSTFSVQFRELGGSIKANTKVQVLQFDKNLQLIADPTNVEGGLVQAFVLDSDQKAHPIDNSSEIEIPENGVLTFAVKGLQPGFTNLMFFPHKEGEGFKSLPQSITRFSIGFLFYSAIRVLPFHNQLADDFADYLETGPDIMEVTQKTFDEVYRTYSLMYPVMDFINNPMKFQGWRGKIMQVTDPSVFESGKYMPATRALSAGQRRILELFDEYVSTLPVDHKLSKKNDDASDIIGGYHMT